MIVEVALAAAPRIGKSFALDAKDRAALRPFGNFQFFLAVQPGNLELGAESRLGDAERNRAVEVRAATLGNSAGMLGAARLVFERGSEPVAAPREGRRNA